jgi:hypothetical protein
MESPVDLAELEKLVATSLGLTTTIVTTGSVGIEGLHAFALEHSINDQPYWLVHTYGLRNFDPIQNHLIAIYTRSQGAWQVVTQLDLTAGGDAANSVLAPDFLGPQGSVTQVAIEPTNLWIQVQGGVGAHSGVYGLLRFDGVALTAEVTGFSSSPGASKVQDLNGDGLLEVLLDASEYYVFCYACGVVRPHYEIRRWDGSQMIQVELVNLADDTPAGLRELNATLVGLAQAGLWKDALAEIDAHATLPTDNETFAWNLYYIRLNGEARRDALVNSSYPLVSHLFYGDFAAALELLREIGADGIFIPDSSLIIGTTAEGWEPTLADWIIGVTDPVLSQQPQLAAAHFLRGWANYLRTQEESAALPDVQKAAELAPDELLFTKSVEFLGG